MVMNCDPTGCRLGKSFYQNRGRKVCPCRWVSTQKDYTLYTRHGGTLPYGDQEIWEHEAVQLPM